MNWELVLVQGKGPLMTSTFAGSFFCCQVDHGACFPGGTVKLQFLLYTSLEYFCLSHHLRCAIEQVGGAPQDL
ncbi:hypothetical protein BT93_E2638 [Corymbia citriodora subsp. variegata]|nr:hypothetical protein BT93_E2638 [Corymbia citriodora subsp. variegata]